LYFYVIDQNLNFKLARVFANENFHEYGVWDMGHRAWGIGHGAW